MKKVLEVCKVTSFGAIKCTVDEKKFVELLKKNMKKYGPGNKKHLKGVLDEPVDFENFAFDGFLQNELEFLFGELKKLSLDEFKNISVRSKPNLKTSMKSPKVKVSRKVNQTSEKKSRISLGGNSPEERASDFVKKTVEIYHAGTPLLPRLVTVKPSTKDNLRWQLVCGINGCESLQCITYENTQTFHQKISFTKNMRSEKFSQTFCSLSL